MWFFYSLFFAIWTAIATLLFKRLSIHIKPLPLLFISLLFIVPSIFLLLLFVGGIPHATISFYIYILISAVLDTIALISFFKAIHRSQISLLAPISSFTPVLTVVFATFTLGETPNLLKLIGILLIVFGAYLLNAADIKQGILAPFKKLFQDKGVRLFLLANFIWAITPIFQKKAIFETSPQIPLYASLIGISFVTLFLIPFASKKSLAYTHQIKKQLWWLILLGIGAAFSQFAAFAAFSEAYVGYAVAIFRLSALFTILLGGLLLKEERIGERLLGASIMVAGTLFIAI